MDMHLTDSAVLITGGSKGIGRACAVAFLAEGARVAIVSRDQANLDAAVAVLKQSGRAVVGVAADLTQAEAAAAMAQRVSTALGPIDVLVNCAGAARRSAVDELNPAAWQAGMAAKYFPYINAMQAVLPAMAERGRGVVVNVIGIGGKVPMLTHLAGGAANSALMLATAGLAQAYGPRGVRINGLNPYLTLTDRVQDAARVRARAEGKTPEQVMAEDQAGIPLRRYAAPAEVADAVVFLASDRSAYINGAIIPMDGGLYASI